MNLTNTLKRPVAGLLPILLLGVSLLAGCGEKLGDPQKFYGELVNAAKSGNNGFMYDVLDSARRATIDTLIGMQMANLEKIPPAERGMWDSLKGKSKREIYGTILSTNSDITAEFAGGYKVLKVDTLVTMTVQHEGKEPNIIYLRPRGGTYQVAAPPKLPEPPMPAGHPPVQAPGGAPGGGNSNGAPNTVPPPSAAPGGGTNGTAPGDSGRK